MMTIIVLVPVVSGLLLLWVLRKDRRRHFIQQRLYALAGGMRVDLEPASELLRRKLRQTAALEFLPESMRTRLGGAFEATGNRVGFLHLAIAVSLSTIIVILFVTRILSFKMTVALPLGLAAGGIAPFVVVRVAQHRYQNQFLDIFPDALDLIARSVRAGLPVNESLMIAAHEISQPVSSELRRAIDQVQIGVPIIEALHETADRVRVADFRFMVVAMALQQKTGGSLAETLRNLSGVIRARKALRLKTRSLTAEAKVSALVLALLPFVVGGAMYVLNNELMHPLFFDPRGRFMLGVAFLSLMTGLITMAVLIKRALR